MAIGLIPKHIDTITLDGLTREQFLILALETAQRSQWPIRYISESGFVANTGNGAVKRNAEIVVKIQGDVAEIKSSATGTEMMDWGRNKKNTQAFIAAFHALRQIATPEALELRYEELSPYLATGEQDLIAHPPPQDKTGNLLSLFKPVEGYFVTPLLLNLNILVFIVMVASGVNIMEPTTDSLIRWGANYSPATLGGQWWRLITNFFLHIGVIHLLLNMYALMYIGFLLEPYLGKMRFFTAYMLAGIVASLASVWWHDITVSAGASGAIFGMYGVFLAMLTTNLIERSSRKPLLVSIAIFVGYNLLSGLKGGIDNSAHIGGLICGAVIGYAFIPGLKKPENRNLKYRTLALVTVLVLAGSFGFYKSLPNNIGIYEAKMKAFTGNEARALTLYNIPQGAPKDSAALLFRRQGIAYWKSNLILLADVEKLKLPAQIRERNRNLKKYCELRIQSMELMAKATEERTDRYSRQLESCNEQINTLLAQLNQPQP